MKVLFSILFLLTVFFGHSQVKRVGFSQVDWDAASVEAAAPDVLAQKLTANYTTDLEKVRSIFRWITENIAYAARRYPVAKNYVAARTAAELAYDSIMYSKPLNEMIAYEVLKKRTAVCNGYTRLFKTLCDYAGIRSEIITGYARTNMGSGKFRSNHTWNAVYIDSSWHLLDVTWASGYISFSNDFVKQYNDYYFLTPPEQLIQSHYPEDLQWTLLSNPPTLREYRQAPFTPSAFVKYRITSFKPERGIIEAAVGDTLQFELETPETDADRSIASEGYYDSSMLAAAPPSWAFLKPDTAGKQKKATYTYPIQNESVEWLHILYNGDVVLRYRLNIRRNDTAAK